MPSKYIRKSNRATSYTKEDLETAIRRVRNKELTNYAASQLYGIPTSTLNDRVRERTGVLSQTLGRPPVIEASSEARLANCLRVLEKWGWGLSKEEVLDFVAEFIKSNGIKTPFRNDRPGDDWFVAFRKRHNLSVKKPQPVEYLRKKMTDPFVIHAYFNLLEEELTRLNLHNQPHKIWNLDETSVSLDPTKTKVVGGTGLPCTRTTAGTGKENITVLTTVNAIGEKMDPLIVFKGKNVYEQWMAEENENYDFKLAYAASKKGWMETDIFSNYMKNIVIPNLGDERPVLMIYDGHVTHVDDRVVGLALEHSITILKLPAHTSHLLQPLDLAVFKSFKSIWDKKLVRWQRENIGSKVRKQAFADMFAKAWHDTSPQVIRNGFKKGGIHPLNPTVIPKEKFDPSAYKRWQQMLEQKKVCQPKTLGQLCIQEIHKQMFHISSAQPQTEGCSKTSADCKSFEELFLESIRKSNNSNTKTARKLKKVASGADVVTRTFLEQKKNTENQLTREERTNCKANTRTEKQGKGKQHNILKDKTNQIHSESDVEPTEEPDEKVKQPNIEMNQRKELEKKQIDDEDQKKEKGQKKSQKRKVKEVNIEIHKKNEQKTKKQLIKKTKKAGTVKHEPEHKFKTKRRRLPSEDTTSNSNTEISFHDDSDIDNIFADDFIPFDTAELHGSSDNEKMSEYAAELSREEEIEKIVQEIRAIEEISILPEANPKTNDSAMTIKKENVKEIKKDYSLPEIPCCSKQVHSTEKKKIIITESIPITSGTKKIKINKTDLKAVDKNFDISTAQKSTSLCNQNSTICVIPDLYDIGDTLLVRYYNKKSWKYFVGVLDHKNNGQYTISFYKAIRKGKKSLTFVQPKRKDVDKVPMENIVKAIELLQISENPAQYVLMDEEQDGIYF